MSIVVAVNDRHVLHSNLLRSPSLAAPNPTIQLIVREGFATASLAYNSGLDEAKHDLVAFIHQDIYLPKAWLASVQASVASLDARLERWGVLGSFGVSQGAPMGLGQVYTTGWGLQGQPIAAPSRVETLDEIVLVLRKSNGLRFDTGLPHFHMYGVDISMTAKRAGLACFAVPAFCVHNTNQLLTLPREFETAYRYVKHKWHSELPIRTSCTVIDRFDLDLRRRKMEALLNWALRRKRTPAPRIEDPRAVLGPIGISR